MNITESFLAEASRFIKRQSLYMGKSKPAQLWSACIDNFVQKPDNFNFYENKDTKGCYLIHKTKRQFLVLTHDGHLITPGSPSKLRLVVDKAHRQETIKNIKQITGQEIAEKYPFFFSKDFAEECR